MSRYCLDTSGYSHFKRGHDAVVELLDSAQWIGVPTIVLGELSAGFETGGRKEQNYAELDEFLSWPLVEVLPVDRVVSRTFGQLVAELRRRGKPLPANDVWIAACCAASGATLITYDAHFRVVDRIGTIVLV